MSTRIALGGLIAAGALAAPATAAARPAAARSDHTGHDGSRRARRGRAATRSIRPRLAARTSGEHEGPAVVVFYRAFGRGTAIVAYGLTRGETKEAYASRRFILTVK